MTVTTPRPSAPGVLRASHRYSWRHPNLLVVNTAIAEQMKGLMNMVGPGLEHDEHVDLGSLEVHVEELDTEDGRDPIFEVSAQIRTTS